MADLNYDVNEMEKLLAQSQGNMTPEDLGEDITIPGPDAQAAPAAPAVPATATEEPADKPKAKTTHTGYKEIFAATGVATDNVVIPMGSEKQRLMAIMSDMAKICGFITPTDAKQEIRVVRVKNKTEFNLSIKESMNKKVAGVIIKYPVELEAAIAAASSDAVGETVRQLEQETESLEYIWAHRTDLTWDVRIFSLKDAISFIARNCFYTIAEAPEIFAPFMKKGGKNSDDKYFNTVADMQQAPYYYLDNKSETYLDGFKNAVALGEAGKKKRDSFLKKLKDITVISPLKSSYRGTMLPAQGNYICMDKFVTIAPSEVALSPAEASELNKTYIAPLFERKRKIENTEYDVYQSLSDAYTPLIKARNENGNKVYDSEFFSTTGASKLANILNNEKHWYGFKQPIASNEIRLVSKTVKVEQKLEKDGTPKVDTAGQPIYKKTVTVNKIAFGKPGNTFDAAGEHKGIVAASVGILTEATVTAFINKQLEATVKKGKGSSTKGKAKHVSSYGYDMAAVLANIDQFTRSMMD